MLISAIWAPRGQRLVRVRIARTLEPPCGPGGIWEPQILVHVQHGTRRRDILAVLHRLASEVEHATPEIEDWTVRVELRGSGFATDGRVLLELSRNDDLAGAEAVRGLTVLRKVLGAE